MIFVTRAQNAKKKKNSSGVEIQRMAIFLSKSIKFKAKNLFCLFFCDGIKRNVTALRNFSKIINQKQIVCNFLTSSALGQKCMLIFNLIFIQSKDALTNIEIRLDYPRIIEYI